MDTIIAGLLHDTIEDTGVTKEELREIGREVAGMVDGVTKLSRLSYKSEEQQVENLKCFWLWPRTYRLAIIKLADRLRNHVPWNMWMRRNSGKPMKPTGYALGTPPGYFKIKWELEDIS